MRTEKHYWWIFQWPPEWGDTTSMKVTTIGATVLSVLAIGLTVYGMVRLARRRRPSARK